MTTSTKGQSQSNLERLMHGASEEALVELAMAAYVDPLTGLLNRRALDRDLSQRLAVAKRGGRPLTVVVGDLDGLKAINDRDGHPAGDLALRTLGAALDSALRAGDTAYRIGGDEFLLLLVDATAEDAEAVLARVSAQAPAFSWGGATFPADGERGTDLVDLADQRLLAGRRHVRGAAPVQPEKSPRASARRAGSALATLAVVVTALLSGVGVGFAAENVRDSRQGTATSPAETTSSHSEDPQRVSAAAEPVAAPVASATEAAVSSPATTTLAVPAPVAPPTALPLTPLEDALATAPSPETADVVDVVDVVEEMLGGSKDEGERDRESSARSSGGPKQNR